MFQIFRSLLIVISLLIPIEATAQQGLGKLDPDSQIKNRPKRTTNVDHPSRGPVWFFTLPGGACRGDDCQSDRERSELIQSKADNRTGESYRYTFSVFFPKDMPDVNPTNFTFWQIKPHGPGKPSVTMELRGDRAEFILHNPNQVQTNKMKPLKPVLIKTIVQGVRGRWLNFTLDARWSHGADGILRLSENGRTLVAHNGPNIDSNSKSQRVRFGLYRSFISRWKKQHRAQTLPTQSAYFANVTRKRIKMSQ